MEEMVLGNPGAAGDAGSQTLENKQDATVTSGRNLINTKASLLDSGEDIEMTNGDTDEDDASEIPSLEDIGLTKKLEAQSAAEEGLEAGVMGVNEEAVSGKGNLESSQEPDDEWLQVLGNGLLKKKVLVAGQNKEQRPQKGQEVTVHLKMTLEDGTEVAEDPSLCFTVGDGDVIQALDLCVQLMDQEEVALIISDAKYAYGSLGSSQPAVPTDTPVHLEVQLLSVSDGPDIEFLTGKERLLLANKKRERGNFCFLRNEYVFAISSYDIALNIVNSTSKVDFAEEEEEELMAVKVKCLNNLAAAQLKLEHFEAALKSSEAALQHQPNNVKALFRKGKVLAVQGEYTEAIPVLRKASRLEPSNKAIQIELSQLLRKQSEQRSMEQAMYRKMLGNMAVPPHSSPSPAPWKIPWKWLFGATAVAIGGMAVSVIVAARTT
ncbi:peptidyl-prolyl cis-trans isomerase FKBP8 [Scyliorhinus canicula]|uniref:peptidyl-prolyl cis-trans isomerase FKBP8 n=1 Tax=Scyliorhinus canicula TaxID=7830 RepID=UPI0018F29218|nr:peptidyl-prolyl cis-trans isomerase FKBP8 [Scyliorhinus canicula]XP_038633559.1 peptidyl-prolyl cis-trans isomerase FKBP8 [Scyliorhinus canicula]XP_038633560.1 peptidyl-prolyl cis-trans isomerase FKBP8 [Scyliorhinus canicula]